jgi:hypothetical protein
MLREIVHDPSVSIVPSADHGVGQHETTRGAEDGLGDGAGARDGHADGEELCGIKELRGGEQL